VIYHGCGNVNRIFEDSSRLVDAYNPLEFKAEWMPSTCVGDLSSHRFAEIWMCNCGRPEVVRTKGRVLTKLNAAKGGIHLQSTLCSGTYLRSYEYVVQLVREHGRYPLHLGEYDIPNLIKKSAASLRRLFDVVHNKPAQPRRSTLVDRQIFRAHESKSALRLDRQSYLNFACIRARRRYSLRGRI